MTQLTRTDKAPSGIKTGNSEVDKVNDQAWAGPGHPGDDDSTSLKKLYEDALKAGAAYNVGRAVVSAAKHDGVPRGFEGEVNVEMSKRMGRSARGFWVPWGAPIERRGLTVGTGAGAVTAQIPDGLMIDVLRPKLAIQKLGGRILNIAGDGPKGNVQLPTKSAASTISWVQEGAAPASGTNPTIQGFVMTPSTALAYVDVTRRMLTLGSRDFEQQVIDDLMTSIAVAVDGAALNGPGANGQPLGLFQFASMPSVGAHGDVGNGGTITYANVVSMNEIVGIFNGDSPATARMGWITSPPGKATLARTDMSSTTSTGRYCWKSHPTVINGELVNVEHMMGYPAIATNNCPSNGTEGTSSVITSLAHGNFDDCLVNLFSGVDLEVNPFLQSTTGVIRISAFQDIAVRFLHGGASFCLCSNIAAIAPQTS